ncbi:MAG: hypothetical protein IJZ79_04885, partial [Bacilli bacterium]|nr:hypothetical protein [Bacilli bacterium]
YNAYDEYENLIVPSNAKEITLEELKKEIITRDDYHKNKEYHDIKEDNINNNKVIRKEKIKEKQRQENEIYDIKELLNKAVSEKKEESLIESTLTDDNYLKKLKIDELKTSNEVTNIELIKDIYNEQIKEFKEQDINDEFAQNEELLETANLSLEILSDLKGEDDKTIISAPIKDEALPKDIEDESFYSSKYKFSKKDFDDKKYKDNILDDEEDEEIEKDNNHKFFFKILMLIFGISLVLIIVVYLFNYFNRV